MTTLWLTLAALTVFVTLWGLIPRNEWWIRGCDFPRLQFIAMGLVAWIGLLPEVVRRPTSGPTWLWVALSLSLAWQIRRVLPYTHLWRRQVLDVRDPQPARQLSILISNVLMPNPHKERLLALAQRVDPDVLLTLETNSAWERALAPLERSHPHTVKVPLDNLYGMHLYSRHPLIDPEVKYLLSPEIPSIHTALRLPSGDVIRFYGLHPQPPSPTEAADSTLRDAELLIVGRHIAEHGQPSIVSGDLNDVAWSRTTRLFQRVSGLLDPRVGRSPVNTYHAKWPVVRWALDHLFHSKDFCLVSMRREAAVGSDHFPVHVVLQYQPSAARVQEAPTASHADRQEAGEAIQEGKEQARDEAPHHEPDPVTPQTAAGTGIQNQSA